MAAPILVKAFPLAMRARVRRAAAGRQLPSVSSAGIYLLSTAVFEKVDQQGRIAAPRRTYQLLSAGTRACAIKLLLVRTGLHLETLVTAYRVTIVHYGGVGGRKCANAFIEFGPLF